LSNLWITPEELGSYADSEFAYEACKTASNLLWAMSGRKFSGVTTVTERYVCAQRSYRLGASSKTYQPAILNGDIYNIPTEEFDDFSDIVSDGMSPNSRIKLRGRPVTKIHTIRTRSGDIVDPSSYYLVDHSTIQAAAGVPWTPCNIEITYSYGNYPPTSGKMAARTLAIEFAKLWSGDDDCALPQRVTSISRQGVSYTLLDSQDFIEELKTGIYAVDLFLKSVNPDKARARSRVFSPDVPRARRYTTKTPKVGTSALDISVPAGGTGVTTVTLEYLNADFLLDNGWTTELTIRNYGETKSKVIDDGVNVITATEKITFSVDYASTLAILGMVDPGSWDLYASRPSPINPGQTETVFVCDGNLSVNLGRSSVTAFTIGSE
jgi:hypothetical protein